MARGDRENRLTLIHATCHVFHRGWEEAVFTLKELRGACRFLRPPDRQFRQRRGRPLPAGKSRRNLEPVRTPLPPESSPMGSSKALATRKGQ